MAAKFELKSKDVDILQEKLRRTVPDAEKTINTYLGEKGAEELIGGVTKYTPVSNWEKKHAKNSMPYKAKPGNLRVNISTKPEYGYLYFPDAGEGTSSKNPVHEGFMQDGVESVYENVVNGLLEAVERIL